MGGAPWRPLGSSHGQWYPIWSWCFCSLCEYSILTCETRGYLLRPFPSKLSTITYLVESYGAGGAASGRFSSFVLSAYLVTHAATALAANGSIRYLLGAVFPLFTIQMYEKLGIHWAGSVFGFLSLALLPIPWILFKFGPLLRKKSHFIGSE